MRKPGGYGVITGPEGKQEHDTFTCAHCNKIVIVWETKKLDEVSGFCMRCMRFICTVCADKLECTPFEKKLDLIESRDRFLRSVGIT